MRHNGKFLWLNRELGICFVNDGGGDNDGGGGGNSDDDGDDDDVPVEELKKALKNARKLERAAIRERDALKREKQQREDGDKTEAEKAAAKIAELENQVKSYEIKEREAKVSSVIAEKAKLAGALVPEDIHALIRGNLEIDDDGNVKNADSAVKAFKELRPQYFQEGNIDSNARGNNRDNGGSEATSMNDAIRRAAGRA